MYVLHLENTLRLKYINLLYKIPSIKNARIHIWIYKYPSTFSIDGIVIYCQICEKKVT